MITISWSVAAAAVAAAFLASLVEVVEAFTTGVVGGIIGIVGGNPDGLRGMNFSINDSPIRYGLVLDALINFAIVGFVLFMIVKAYNKMAAEKKVAPSDEVRLLTEIRDALKR